MTIDEWPILTCTDFGGSSRATVFLPVDEPGGIEVPERVEARIFGFAVGIDDARRDHCRPKVANDDIGVVPDFA